MRFMLLCYDNEKDWEAAGEAVHQAAMQEAVQLTHQLQSQGQYLLASPLHSVTTAKSVRVRNGKRAVTDGPFSETKEQLGGFYLIDVPTIEDAIRVAEQHPGARLGTVEVRPVMIIPGLPPEGCVAKQS